MVSADGQFLFASRLCFSLQLLESLVEQFGVASAASRDTELPTALKPEKTLLENVGTEFEHKTCHGLMQTIGFAKSE